MNLHVLTLLSFLESQVVSGHSLILVSLSFPPEVVSCHSWRAGLSVVIPPKRVVSRHSSNKIRLSGTRRSGWQRMGQRVMAGMRGHENRLNNFGTIVKKRLTDCQPSLVEEEDNNNTSGRRRRRHEDSTGRSNRRILPKD